MSLILFCERSSFSRRTSPESGVKSLILLSFSVSSLRFQRVEIGSRFSMLAPLRFSCRIQFNFAAASSQVLSLD